MTEPTHGPIDPAAADEFPPMADIILIDDDGDAWVPSPYFPGARHPIPMRHGIALAWTPFAEGGGACLILWSGNPTAPGDEAIVTTMSRDGLQGLIADLQSIDRQMEAML